MTIIPSTTAEVSAPPAPWTKRAPISTPWLWASAHSTDARGEDGEADQEDPPLADQVAEAPGQQQQAAERDQVGVDHPGEVALREAEVVLDRGQRDVHDRRVDHDHQHGGAEHIQRHPAVAIVGLASAISVLERHWVLVRVHYSRRRTGRTESTSAWRELQLGPDRRVIGKPRDEALSNRMPWP